MTGRLKEIFLVILEADLIDLAVAYVEMEGVHSAVLVSYNGDYMG